jgi:hypothetical protein
MNGVVFCANVKSRNKYKWQNVCETILKKTRNVRINVTFRRVRVTIVTVEKQ